ncbi:unnamed protein product [Chilo suppressalis]|uniref:Activating transcription factor 7-interacting protein Fn3 domain-containing protein n=1 Tax=Chilo suppressalis TaxID=168631 RepID=A0ABN8AXM9_CHISP|nr:unnamed protein product [Chilo suppressalis]
MQLILDTEASINIKEKMATLEEPSEKSVSDDIETLKTVINNGNKENIQCQENVIRNSEEETNGIEKDDEEVNSSLPIKDTGVENDDNQLVNGIKENCIKATTNGNAADKENEQQLDINIENKVQTLDNDLIAGKDNDTVKQDNGLLESNLKEISNTLNVEADINIDNLKEISSCVVEEKKEHIIKQSEGLEIVPEIMGETSMEVDNETENIELCNVKSNDNCTETSFEIPKSISLIGDAVEVCDDVTEEAELNKSVSSSSEMDVDVPMLNISNVIDSEKIDEKPSNCDDGVATDNQSILKTDQVVDVKNTPLINSEVILEKFPSTNNMVLENTMIVDKAILEDSLSVDEKTIAETLAKNLELDNQTNEEIRKDLSSADNEVLIDKTTDENKILENTVSIDQVPFLEKKSNDEAIILETESSKFDEKDVNTTVIDKDGVLETVPSICKEVVENNSLTDAKDTKEVEIVGADSDQSNKEVVAAQSNVEVQKKKPFSKLVNTLDILSDDEDDSLSKENETVKSTEKQTINIEDDDDIMLIDEDISRKDKPEEPTPQTIDKLPEEKKEDGTVNLENSTENIESNKLVDSETAEVQKDIILSEKDILKTNVESKEEDKLKEKVTEKPVIEKPLLPENFLKSHKKSLADMTRDDLEEFCILKIVESIVDRSNLSDIKSKLKEMAQSIEEYKKKSMMLTKQNRDLQVVLKSVQEEQKKNAGSAITPLKITRSVGMQVLMTEKAGMRKKLVNTTPTTNNNARNVRTPNQSPKSQKPATPTVNQTIPVPRLIPANNPVAKMPAPAGPSLQTSSQAKTPSPVPNGVRNSPPVQKIAEKRPISRVQSITVDLTDDEPPAKIVPRSSPAPPIRLVASQNLLAPRPPFGQTLNSPRKVYIPISGPQSQNIRPGQAIMLKTVQATGPGPRPRAAPPHVTRMPQTVQTVRMQSRIQNRHPAPLPDAVKQYQPPNWKALPPAPDLKLSKVENGIVISWKIEGYQEDSYEEIASYQLYAYQETSSPPSTALWKKIGDVKALPLPMACTLTHVMAGFKYYFAVRAVDVRSRLGPFSLPGSILLLNKL